MAVWVRPSNLHFCFAKDYKQLLGNTDTVGAAEKCVKVSGILMLLFFPQLRCTASRTRKLWCWSLRRVPLKASKISLQEQHTHGWLYLYDYMRHKSAKKHASDWFPRVFPWGASFWSSSTPGCVSRISCKKAGWQGWCPLRRRKPLLPGLDKDWSTSGK